MAWSIATFIVASAIATGAHMRLAVFRRDQRWRRERGEAFGDPLMSVGYGEDLSSDLYTVEGLRFRRWVFLADALAVAAFLWMSYTLATR
jgi:hypothetical protein